ncbi:O-antigen ligase family protein [Gryllotalpicola protaetiae]|uniref:O-antigen ligase domain-containing protein n=1 Tax=Gryllotalpicola protaetiae TaxID=2419771 RepID=A0A387BTC0_9MICO|nr:O-antigen ligase family protein [Gryllotalpicola protaetiae]AYG04286.1 O-antigen ligase domain-containing protein [Gryllotalpicola protaetiae]
MTNPVARLHPAAGILATLSFFTVFAGDFWRNLIGWPAYLALAGVLAIANVVWIFIARPQLTFRKWPKMLLLFVALAIASIAWARYEGVSGPGGHVDVTLGVAALLAAGVAGLAPALILNQRLLVKVLSSALRWVLGLSLLFELVVALFVRHPILPLMRVAGVDYTGKVPGAFYWSRNDLLHGGPIQGIVGNADLLAMCALIGLIVFSLQRADRISRPFWGWFWIVLAAVELALTRSATVLVATAATAVVLGFALWARARSQKGRGPLYLSALLLLVVVVGGALTAWHEFTALFGKSPTLTGRTDIWNAVIPLAQQHPVFGWGWLGYWVPWAKPFDGLAVRHGVQYLQAHNAWLDVWLQLGIVGVVVFALLAVTTLGRAWFMAVDRPMLDASGRHPFTAVTLLPLLVFAAQLVQSLAESRLLLESGWALLVVWSVTTKASRP